MGFSVQIQAEYGAETLQNIHPDGRFTGGKAILAFLMGLHNYCNSFKAGQEIYPGLEGVIEWYQQLDTYLSESLCTSCNSLLDCMWGNGGDSTEYSENEYEFYKKRTAPGLEITEEQFHFMVHDSRQHWKPIEEVITGVQVLLNLFKSQSLEELEGFYDRQYTIPDFEALLANLEFLAKRHNHVVRLNFS
jgi:hypothetical protein